MYVCINALQYPIRNKEIKNYTAAKFSPLKIFLFFFNSNCEINITLFLDNNYLVEQNQTNKNKTDETAYSVQ